MFSVEVDGLTVAFNGNVVLDNVSFKLPHPSISVIMGPNGAGKSTLLKTLMGLIKPKSGKVRVFGIDPIKDKKRISSLVAYVPQKETINETVPLRVKDILAQTINLRRGPLSFLTRKDVERINEVLQIVGLSKDVWTKRFRELSGGQQQKAFLARALLLNPKLLILDEPFNGVDVVSQREIMDFLVKLKERGVSILMVLHDVNPFVKQIDYLLVLNRRLIGFGRPTEVLNEDVLREAYGSEIEVIRREDICYAIIGDKHA